MASRAARYLSTKFASNGLDELDPNSVNIEALEQLDGTAGGMLGRIDLGEENHINIKGESKVRDTLWQLDPGLNQTLISSGTTVSQLFNQDKWEHHRRIGRYWEHLLNIAHSTVFRRVLTPCIFMMSVATAVCCWNSLAPAHLQAVIAIAPHTLLGAALSLLLVFRTNTCYQRFQTGRSQWGALLKHLRDWMRLTTLYFPPDLAARAAKLADAYAVVCKSHLRAGRTRADPTDLSAFKDDPAPALKQLLGDMEADEIISQKNMPLYVSCKMTDLVQQAYNESLRARERGMMPAGSKGFIPRYIAERLDIIISDTMADINGCEGILSTPIPLSYTRHTTRSLMLWLGTLPFALYQPLGWLSIPAIFIISFIFTGIDEIGVEIEEPFAVLPLTPIVKVVERDVGVAVGYGAAREAAMAHGGDDRYGGRWAAALH